MLSAFANGQMLRPQIISEIAQETTETPITRTLFLPAPIQQMLLRGMDLVVSGEKGQARPAQIKKFWGRKELYLDYKALKHKLIGKTSTAELLHTPYILPSYAAKKYKDIWFASLYYPQTVGKGGAPELCIVVYLKYGESGKEAAPIAAQIIKEYERLKQKYN